MEAGSIDVLHPAPSVMTRVAEIEAEGDMDFQGKIITKMLKKRKVATLLPRVAADAVKAIFS